MIPTLREVLRQVRDTPWRLLARTYGSRIFVQALERERALKRSSLCQVLFSSSSVPYHPPPVPGLALRVMEAKQGMTGEEPGSGDTFDCILMMRETPRGLTGSSIYKTALFEAAYDQAAAGRFPEVLARWWRSQKTPSTLGAPWEEAGNLLDTTASIDTVAMCLYMLGGL